MPPYEVDRSQWLLEANQQDNARFKGIENGAKSRVSFWAVITECWHAVNHLMKSICMRWLRQFEVDIPDQFLGMRLRTEIGDRPRIKNYKLADFVLAQLLEYDIGKNISFADRVGERSQRTCEVRLLFTNI